MSIRLLQSIFIAGVLSPVDGSTLSLSAALEADLVNQGKAAWVRRPKTASAGNRQEVIIETMPDTGGKIASVAGGSGGLLSVTGRAYTSINLPLSQAGGASVLPADYSDNRHACTIGVANTTPWNWPGVLHIAPDAAGSQISTPAAAVELDLFTDSFIVGFTPIIPVTGSAYYFAGNTDLSAKNGLAHLIGTTGLLGVRMQVSGGQSFSGTFGAATVGGGFVGAKTDATGYAIGLGTVTMANAGKGVITIGDIVRFGTDKQNYTITAGDADVSAGAGAISFTPTLQKAIPAAATEITLVGGARVHRVMVAYDAPSQTLRQYVDGVTDFARALSVAAVAGDRITDPYDIGRPRTGLASISQFSGFQFLKFANSGLPMNIDELAVIDNTRRRMGLLDVPLFF